MSNVYIVKSGDTLWGISKKHRITVKELARINSLSGRMIHNLKIGQKIHLKDESSSGHKYETQLKIVLMDLSFKSILKATIQLDFDGKKIIKNTTNGIFDDIGIEDHSKGLKVFFKNINGSFDLIADHKTLPLGRKVLKLTSRKIKVEGSHYVKEGLLNETASEIKNSLKRVGKPIVDGVSSVLESLSTTKNPHQPQRVASKEKNQLPEERQEQKRTDAGNSTHIIAAQFTEDNFLLKPVNNKYRAYIVSAAKRHGFTAHSLAAVIDAEAAKIKKTGEWNVNSKANSSSAAGLTQFLDGTWLAMCNDRNSLVGQYVKNNPKLTKEQKLNLRFNAEMAIDAAAAYAVSNFKTSGLPYQNLTEPSSMAKFAYLLHHEGASGGKNFVLNTLSSERAKKLLFIQFGKNGTKQAEEFLKRYKGDAKAAYGAWLRNYIDGHINIYQYVVDKSKTSGINLSMEETIKLLKGQSVPSPISKEQKVTSPVATQTTNTQQSAPKSESNKPQVQSDEKTVGGDEGWHNPLRDCKLRTAGLANAKGATFGKVRNNGTKNHQGVDLQANPGTKIYAVCGGVIVFAKDSGGAYGKVIVLRVDINDLAEKQKKYAQSKLTKNQYVYFFYAHLSDINVDKDDPVDTGEEIGKTGSTGNANKMTAISNGAHLHFEARSAPLLGVGLDGRIDPIPFINANLPY
ncbi:peptidase M23 [Acinetobacter sp. NRRL B-65365]|uniref:peptidoglycan DD-metalloendopeptidase family protein n=1 Tax=Acinetobacter sp. NRRL B-65365 TaxID=1785092 RepID=UPI0007A04285|nr:LysM peptidoglycan-binding domain-containing M23 family metallopeptidase [Acinetobacter sp. NRRL B-65365]KYQ83521.1 peptidase M23 [Acinetobacter sp. NRRL B-65365]